MSVEINRPDLEASSKVSLRREAIPTAPHDDMAFQAIAGELVPRDELLQLICDRIRTAGRHLDLSREDLSKIFRPFRLFEGEAAAWVDGKAERFLIIEAHHLMQGKVGKGALKIVLPRDLIREGPEFVEATPRVAEVIPTAPKTRWDSAAEAWAAVREFLRELIIGETISMSLKSQTTGTLFTGSEGVILCAVGEYDSASGRFFLKPVTKATEADQARDKELLEAVMNSTAEVLTRAGQIAHDRIVHAAETNSTLTSRLKLQLPSNVVEGHLRALLRDDPHMVIGDEDMTARLRSLLGRPDYRPTACVLAKEAARMQAEHSILMLNTREKLRAVLEGLPADGLPSAAQFREIVGIFFGVGETQQTEDQIFHHRESILRSLSAALSAGRLDECDDHAVLTLFLRVLLDNQAKLMKAVLLKSRPLGEPLPADWFARAPLLTAEQEDDLRALLPLAAVDKPEVKRRFARLLEMLTAMRNTVPAEVAERYHAARRVVLEQAIRAITFVGGVIPSVDRIRFLVTPFTFECVTPKLGVITRKPLEVCGSELRPVAMAAGAVMALEALLRSRGAPKDRPFAGLTVAIQGLGNAGKGVARLLHDQGARILAASDSQGAIIVPAGMGDRELTALLQHKSAGKRLDTFLLPGDGRPGAASRGPSFVVHKNPDALKTVKADLLVLTAKAGALDAEDARRTKCKIVCELTGAAVTGEAKDILRQRSITVLPDNLGSSGGLLVSLSEMLQNSFGEQWERELEVTMLRQQIERSHDAILKIAEKHSVDLATASDILALQRMHALAIYAETLAARSRQLKEQIQAIGAGETVLVVSDDDDDGVASAAIFREFIARLNPGREKQILYASETLRSRAILDLVEAFEQSGPPVKQVFVLDRSFPLTAAGQEVTADLARRCRLTLINNHELPAPLLGTETGVPMPAELSHLKSPADMGVLLISPQILKATVSARHFTTALVLKEIAHQLISDPQALTRIDWQAAIGSCLDVTPESSPEWLLFYAQFNPDDMRRAARAVRIIARAHGFMNAIRAVEEVDRPDQLETNQHWEQFMGTYQLLAERVQLLVEKIAMENRGRPYVSHLFSSAEVASPVPETRCLDLYPWISEHLTKHADFSEKPIIVGQVVTDLLKRNYLGVRIRSPQDVELMEVGLPECFRTGGLPNTAVAKIALEDSVSPEQQFQALVENIWWKTVSPTLEMKRSGAGRKPI